MGRRFGLVPPEVPATRDLDALAPKFRAAVEAVVADLTRDGFDPLVFETLRTPARQRHIYGFGRTYDDGRGVVTHSADADETWHGFGLAADIISRSAKWGAPLAFWLALGAAARRHGCLWGGDWNANGDHRDERFPDFPHIQWGAPMRRSPSPRAARLLADGGMAAVWREVGAA